MHSFFFCFDFLVLVCWWLCRTGPERAFSLRIPHLGMRLAFIAGLTIPVLAKASSWRLVPYTYAAVSAAFGVGHCHRRHRRCCCRRRRRCRHRQRDRCCWCHFQSHCECRLLWLMLPLLPA